MTLPGDAARCRASGVAALWGGWGAELEFWREGFESRSNAFSFCAGLPPRSRGYGLLESVKLALERALGSTHSRLRRGSRHERRVRVPLLNPQPPS